MESATTDSEPIEDERQRISHKLPVLIETTLTEKQRVAIRATFPEAF